MPESAAPTPENILATPLDYDHCDATTVRAYLCDLLDTLWDEGSNFSAKRPLGMDDWQWLVYTALVKAGHVPGALDEDGYLVDFSREQITQADRLIAAAIAHIFRTDPASPAPAPA